MSESKRILVCDDEPDIREVVSIILKKSGFCAVTAENGEKAVELVSGGESFDLVIMDIMMPGMNGIQAAGAIRRLSDCPILFLTARSSDNDKIDAYESGGDDFLSKPFSRVELLLRINALLKRNSSRGNGVLIDTVQKTVTKNGRYINLTKKEYELLEFMYLNRGTPFTVEELYTSVWNEKYFSQSANTVMVHILNLRKKLESDFARPEYIKTVWGKGYCYAET